MKLTKILSILVIGCTLALAHGRLNDAGGLVSPPSPQLPTRPLCSL